MIGVFPTKLYLLDNIEKEVYLIDKGKMNQLGPRLRDP
jgi:hypothetical protein